MCRIIKSNANFHSRADILLLGQFLDDLLGPGLTGYFMRLGDELTKTIEQNAWLVCCLVGDPFFNVARSIKLSKF